MNESYSQLYQDKWVLSLLPINNGFFVDIGYRHPININNTYLLELNGWSGVGVDPLLCNGEQSDDGILSLEENLVLRPKTKLYNCAIYSSSNLEIDFIKAGPYSGITEYSFLYKRIMEKHSFCETVVKVKTKTLEDFLIEIDAPKNIHYLSLDTEGSEYEILKVFPFDKFIFGCITVEHNKNIDNKTKIRDLLESNGYEIAKDRRHDFFCVNKNLHNIFLSNNDNIQGQWI